MRTAGPAILVPTLALSLALAGCHRAERAEPSVHRAWIRLAATPAGAASAYFTLAGGSEPGRLVAIASPRVDRIELGEATAGTTRIQPIDGVDIAPRAAVVFEPGKRSAMLIGIDPAARAGGTIKLGFRFAKGRPTLVDARIVAAGDAAPY